MPNNCSASTHHQDLEFRWVQLPSIKHAHESAHDYGLFVEVCRCKPAASLARQRMTCTVQRMTRGGVAQ
jgi:hypothetical protein